MRGRKIRIAGQTSAFVALTVIAALLMPPRSAVVTAADAEGTRASSTERSADPSRVTAANQAWQFRIADPGTDVFAAGASDGDSDAPWTEDDARLLAETLSAPVTGAARHGKITIDYPLVGAVFPPEMCPPTFLWHDADERTDAWLIVVTFEKHPKRIVALTTGQRTYREIDPRCVTDANQWTEPPYQASARGWTPNERTWSILKQRSIEGKATVAIHGLVGVRAPGQEPDEHGGADAARVVSRGSVTITTSADPVGAPIFYRDVPLMPTATAEGLVKPLVASAMPLIQWRLRDIAKPAAPIVMGNMPTCGNCHSFSQSGDTLAMDMDGPSGDKGAHVVKDVSPHMVIEQKDVFSWNSFNADPTKLQQQQSFGLFPRISPDGQHIVATVHESVHVRNYVDWQFLQTFYPTRGILAVFDRRTREIHALPGADDPRFVQSNAVWSPDGRELVFIRAAARRNYGDGERSEFANDPRETQIQYDLYRIPFNGGRGGTPTPIPGASANGMSNSFAKFSPDGKWIVFVQAKNGLLMRPDSQLYIIPAEGGEPRLMNCNTPRMNSWHGFSPNGRWMVFSSKWPSPFTQMYLTHIDENGIDTPAVLIPNSTAANRAVNLPEFAAIPPGGLINITTPASDYRRHLDQARGLAEKKQFNEAIVELERSLALRSDFAETHYMYGVALIQQGELAEAIGHFRKAVACDPLHREAYTNMGLAFIRLDQPADAVAALAKALQIDGSTADTHTKMGVALKDLGRLDDAIGHFETAVELDPQFHLGQYEWAMTLTLNGDLNESLPHFAEAARLNPDHAATEYNWGLTLWQLGQRDEARRHYRNAVAIEPRSALAHESLASALHLDGQYAEAVEHYAIAVEIRPRNNVARDRLAKILATTPDDTVRDGAGAVHHAEITCRNTDHAHPGFLVTLAVAQAEVGRFDDAIATAEQAERIANDAGNEVFADIVREFIARFREHQPIRTGREPE